MALMNFLRPAGVRFPLASGFPFAGEPVRRTPTRILREMATADIAEISLSRTIPSGVYAGQTVESLDTSTLERIAAQATDGVSDQFAKSAAAAALSDETWLQQQARRELQWRCRKLAIGELQSRGESIVVEKPAIYGGTQGP
jgi:hypothetical protein